MSRCDGCAAVADSPTWGPGSPQLAEAQEGGQHRATSIQGDRCCHAQPGTPSVLAESMADSLSMMPNTRMMAPLALATSVCGQWKSRHHTGQIPENRQFDRD